MRWQSPSRLTSKRRMERDRSIRGAPTGAMVEFAMVKSAQPMNLPLRDLEAANWPNRASGHLQKYPVRVFGHRGATACGIAEQT